MKPKKLTSAQKNALLAVFEAERKKLETRTDVYDNTLGCPNCGDVGGSYSLLYRLELALGLRKE